jgi:hypothetical protein
VNIEPHHTRLHWKSILIRWTLPPLALLATVAWLYFSVGTCQEDGDAVGSVCRALRVIPFLPSLAALAVGAFIVWDLIKLGREVHFERHGVKPRPHLKHVVHGYNAVAPRHQKHLHRTLLNLLAVTGAVAAWIAWQAYQSTH